MLRQKAECFFWYRRTRVVPEQRPLKRLLLVVLYLLYNKRPWSTLARAASEPNCNAYYIYPFSLLTGPLNVGDQDTVEHSYLESVTFSIPYSTSICYLLLRIRGFLKWYALYKFTFYLLTYLHSVGTWWSDWYTSSAVAACCTFSIQCGLSVPCWFIFFWNQWLFLFFNSLFHFLRNIVLLLSLIH